MTAIIDGKYHYLWSSKEVPDSRGGTERLTERLSQEIDQELLSKFIIISSRLHPDENIFLRDDKIRIFWAHDLPGDPAMDFLKTNKKDWFHKYVFVSTWQMQRAIEMYNLPWEKCIVIQNAIDPINISPKPSISEGIRFVYHSVPRKGLNIVIAAFEQLAKKYPNVHLDVYSSYNLYGWPNADEELGFNDLFTMIDEHPQMTNHGAVENDRVRIALNDAHVWVHPASFAETSCMCLMEAMSAGAVCVHSNYGAMYETAANWTQMYQFSPDQRAHAGILLANLEGVVQNIEPMLANTGSQKAFADVFYSWTNRKLEWNALLQGLVNTIKDTSVPQEMFTIKTGT